MNEQEIIAFLGDIEQVIKRDLTQDENTTVRFLVDFHEVEPSVIAERVETELEGDITYKQVYEILGKYF